MALGTVNPGEPCMIGRGELNIEGMPVYRDAMWVESVRRPVITSVLKEAETGTLFKTINVISGMEGLQEAADYMLSSGKSLKRP